MKNHEKLHALISDFQAGNTSVLNDIFEELYTTRRQFILESRYTYFSLSQSDLEAIFDDSVLETLKVFNNTGQYVGFLRVRLASRLKDLCRKELRIWGSEREHMQKVARFTRNPMFLQDHDVEFRDYVSRLEPRLQQACKLLEAGLSMKAVAQQLGYGDQRTLKNQLRKAFDGLMETAVAIDSRICEKPSIADLQPV